MPCALEVQLELVVVLLELDELEEELDEELELLEELLLLDEPSPPPQADSVRTAARHSPSTP